MLYQTRRHFLEGSDGSQGALVEARQKRVLSSTRKVLIGELAKLHGSSPDVSSLGLPDVPCLQPYSCLLCFHHAKPHHLS